MEKEVKPTGYDIIGDIHGHCDELRSLLGKMGYECDETSYFHPGGRQAIFVGDLIDRGPKVRETLELVHAMHRSNRALVIIGNHEYNAVGHCTMHHTEADRPLREMSTGSKKQFQPTVDSFIDRRDEWDQFIDWFKTLPLYLDMGPFRVVHACWSQRHIDFIGDRNLGDYEFLQATATNASPEYQAIETVLKGPELNLPDGAYLTDHNGIQRTNIRVKWWEKLEGINYRTLCYPEVATLPDTAVEPPVGGLSWDIYPAGAPPVYVGHYSLPPIDKPASAGNVTCLDYSIGKGGYLCAVRVNPQGETEAEGFVKA